MTAEFVGSLAENLVLQRACVMHAPHGMLCGHVYGNQWADPSGPKMGKYAVLLHLHPINECFSVDHQAMEEFGNSVGQHIIGMNPEVIDEQEGVVDQEKVLTKQGFVLDDTMTVGDMLVSRDAKVTKFIRFAVGETGV